MLQMMACLTIASKYSDDNSAEHTHLSPSGLAQCKLLLYGTLVKHYSITNRLPLLPQHMTDVYTAITELLGKNTGSDVTVRFLRRLQPCSLLLQRFLITSPLAAQLSLSFSHLFSTC